MERHETPDPARSDAVEARIQCVRAGPRAPAPSGNAPSTLPQSALSSSRRRESELAIVCCECTVSYGGTVRPCWPDNSIGGDRFRLRYVETWGSGPRVAVVTSLILWPQTNKCQRNAHCKRLRSCRLRQARSLFAVSPGMPSTRCLASARRIYRLTRPRGQVGHRTAAEPVGV